MKNKVRNSYLLFFVISILIYSSCKKSDSDPEISNAPCNFTTNLIEIDGTLKNITAGNCYNAGLTFTSEQYVDSGHTEGLTMIFDGSTTPLAGSYDAVNTLPVLPGKVYLEYFETVNAYQPTSGKVTVTDNGSSKVFTFCNLSFAGGVNTKLVSSRATCN
jgi:hypothetical protein